MFQFVGSVLALATVLAILVAAPAHGLVFAFATLFWVIKAKPAPTSIVEANARRGGAVVFIDQFR